MSAPLVSVVIATYNRSNVLRLAIESVRSSPTQDWELIVIGDACTDDTGDVVGAFHDPRIRFVNLPVNHGEQSGPNNEGVQRARGRYVAFLNHDDLWTAEHLPLAVAELEQGAAPFVHTLSLGVLGDGRPRIIGATHGTYEPWAFAPASTWVVRREVFREIGPWRDARALHIAPSQEWLFRAWKRGLGMRTIPVVTVVSIFSGSRRGSYSERQSAEHERWAAGLRAGPRFLLEQITAAAITNPADDVAVIPHFVRGAKNAVRRLALAAGVHPSLPRALGFGLRRGSFLDHLRRTRGLTPLSRKELGS